MKKNFSVSIFTICLFCFAMKSNAQWNLTGNSNAIASSILGTTNAFPLNLTTNNVQRMVIDANGKIGIGTSTPINILTVKGAGSTPAANWVAAGAPLFVGFGENAVGNADYILAMASTSNNGRPVFVGRRSRGTLAVPTAMSNNDFIMSLLASAHDGTAFQNPATIDFIVDGTPSAGNVPARISFVTGSNSSNRAERLKIGNTGDITFNTNQFFLQKTTGNIGIGTITPAAKLDVSGQVKITGGSPATGKVLTSDNAGLASWTTPGVIPWTISGNDIANSNSGNVGIGTAAPGQKLDINGNLQFSNATLPKSFMDEGLGTTPLFTMGVNFHEATVNQVYRGGAYRLDTRNNAALHNWFARLPNSADEKLIMALSENGGLAVGSTFTSNIPPTDGAIFQGNVGIGNSNPQYKLHVNGDVFADGGNVRISGNNGVLFPSWGGGWYMSDGKWVRTFGEKNVWTGNGLLGSQGGLTIGFGGTTPETGGANIEGNVGIGIEGQFDRKLYVYSNTSDAISGFTSQPYGTAVEGIYIGFSMIGTGIYGSGSPGFAGYFNGNVSYTGNLTGPSDVRLKENIKPLENALSLISKLDAKTYSFKKEYAKMNLPKGEQYGLIAQDLEKVMPNLVQFAYDKSMDKDHPFQYKAINYIGLIPILSQAIKEQQIQIDTKDVTITKLQEQVVSLQSQMTNLLNRVNILDATQLTCFTAAQQNKVVDNKQTVTLTSASLDQNVPNPPVNRATRIGYNVPKGAGKAEMIITDNYGKKLKKINLSVIGKGLMNVDTSGLAPGTYSYTLVIDGKMIDTKQMVVAGQ